LSKALPNCQKYLNVRSQRVTYKNVSKRKSNLSQIGGSKPPKKPIKKRAALAETRMTDYPFELRTPEARPKRPFQFPTYERLRAHAGASPSFCNNR